MNIIEIREQLFNDPFTELYFDTETGDLVVINRYENIPETMNKITDLLLNWYEP